MTAILSHEHAHGSRHGKLHARRAREIIGSRVAHRRMPMSQSEIAAVNRQFEDAARKGDLDRLVSLYTSDAIALPPDGPVVKGRDAIKQMWGTLAQQTGLKEVRLQTLDFEQAGDTGYEVGEATLALASGTAVMKFVVVWKKIEGQWRLHRDIWNTKAS
ncbi:MAG TPA: DUF4440 domain-containing protein [Thermoleophilaceae bacterium]|nr:DUF4440 domain-containing protein [Thermoleophilaceae bacterium]